MHKHAVVQNQQRPPKRAKRPGRGWWLCDGRDLDRLCYAVGAAHGNELALIDVLDEQEFAAVLAYLLTLKGLD